MIDYDGNNVIIIFILFNISGSYLIDMNLNMLMGVMS